jgi:23S rRNA (pseudouridine1915-N3)-methyltransferase
MKISFLFTGKTENGWIRQGMEGYLGRLKHYADLELIELADPKNAGKMDPAALTKAEGELQLSKISPADRLILLDERGKEFSSSELSVWFNKQQLAGYKKMVFLVGGPFGFSEAVYKRADVQLSLSKLTFSHQMIRILLTEQVYRAFTILRGEKYHHQ